jgi:PAS domain S-box-containing protein
MTASEGHRVGRDRLAEELERQKQYFESLLQISPAAVVTTDLDTRVTSWNPEAERLFGYTSDEAYGSRVDDLIAPSDELRAEAATFVDETSRTGAFRAVTRRMRKDGTLVDVDLRAATVAVDGEAVGYYVLYHDISELQRQKQYYASLLEISPAAIVVTQLDTTVVSWNPAAERLFGYTAEEACGRLLDTLVAARPELRYEAEAYSRAATRGERVQAVARRTRKDGSLVDVLLVSAPVLVANERTGVVVIYHDISELQRQRRYYESLLELSPMAIATVDRNVTVTSWNAAAERLFGYPREEAIGRNLNDLVAHTDELRREAAEVDRQAERTEVHRFTRRARKDGSLVDVHLVGAPIVVSGEHVGNYAIYSDVSELQRQRRYYESLLESSPSAIVTLNLDSTVTSWNAAAERLFGYTSDEAIGQNVEELLADRDDLREEAVAMTRRGMTEGEAHLVTRRLHKDGSLVDVHIVGASIVVAGEQVGLYAIYSDVRELQRQRRYYEALFELSPTAIATVDRDLKVTSWNAAAERLFGYTREEALGGTLNDLVANTDELRLEGAELDRETERGEVRRVTRRMRKDGSLVDVDLRAAPIVVAGETVGLFVLYHDISELQRARREAEAATEAKSAFLATMSHEIRTPMNAVIGMTELLLGTGLDAEQRSFADVIRTSGEALLSVINDVLDFSKIEAGRLDLEEHPFDLRECVESAMDVVAPSAAAKGLDLAYVLDPGTPEALVGDATRLRQILLNLLNNAVKFTERGEVVLTVTAEPVSADDDGRYRIHFAVGDTGIGIPEEQMERLFESFSQVDTSTTRRYGGSGLGLAISRRLSEFMGGTSWAESRVGEGSTFHFTIEAEAAPRPVRTYERGPTEPLAGKRVLILDDNATNRHILRAQTESWGMLPRDTGSPAEALQWIRRGDPFDVAILDMQMPEMDGIAVAREIRRHRDAGRLRLMLLTSLGRREAADDVEFAAHLTKPIRTSQLYDSLIEALGGPALVRAEQRAPSDASVTPADLRVLVVEDNAVNQQLALLLLRKLGYEADVAGNGVEALEVLGGQAYDVVLMDVQMPEMDGLEATRQIHERWPSARPRIIAATANATTEERERCLAAGMDDYLSKPIRIDELAAALGGAQARVATVDASVLERLRATIGSADAAEMVRVFLDEAPSLLASLREAVDTGSADRLRRAAHNLKSNAATFGAAALSELARELEAAGSAGTLEGASGLLARTEDEYERVRSNLEAAVGGG